MEQSFDCGCIRGTVGFGNSYLKGSVNLLATDIKGEVGIICTPNTDVYLRVSPEVIWLTPDMFSSGEFAVKANVHWEIVLEYEDDDKEVVSILANSVNIDNNTYLIN